MTIHVDARGAFLPELLATLWPDEGAGAATRYRLVPSKARPRLVVPADEPRAAADILRYSVEPVGRAARARRTFLATALRTGAGRVLFRDTVEVPDGIATYLAGVLGRPVRLGVHIGPARANRKPVLTLVGPEGGLAGFAKLGVNPLTRVLVDREAAALSRLAAVDLGPVEVPGVLHHGHWREHTVLVQSPLPVWLPRAAPGEAPAAESAALVRLARAFGTRTAPYHGGPYSARLAAAVAVAAATGDPAGARLVAVHDEITRAGPDTLELGCWHGDFNGANSAVLAGGRVLVWDWERFAEDVPVGFDALHRELQTSIVHRGVTAPVAAAWLIQRAPAVLAAFDVETPAFVAALYLVELGARYMGDRQRAAGAELGRLEDWLLPVLERYVREVLG
jgi:hypothetical protein